MESKHGVDVHKLRDLEHWQQLAVAAAVVARMQPNFALFCEVSGQQGQNVYTSALGVAWEFIAGLNDAIDFGRQREKLEAVTPDPGDHDMYGVWPALDACVALSSLLSACEQFEAAEVSAVLELSLATIAGFIEATGQVEADHVLYRVERDFLREVLETVATDGASRREVVAAVRKLAAANPQSNIGLHLDG